VPESEINPAFRPWLMLQDTKYIMLGPGVSTIPSATTVIPTSAAPSGTIRPFVENMCGNHSDGTENFLSSHHGKRL
jgi:hypothetical protein